MSGELVEALFQEPALIEPGISPDELEFSPVLSHLFETARLASLTG